MAKFDFVRFRGKSGHDLPNFTVADFDKSQPRGDTTCGIIKGDPAEPVDHKAGILAIRRPLIIGDTSAPAGAWF